MNEFLLVLIEMERNGVFIETDLLDEVEKEFTKEYHQVHNKIKTIIQRVMGILQLIYQAQNNYHGWYTARKL